MRQDVPALIPARMLNEYFYCPRLFFLEWVQGEWADSDDTVEGRSLHQRTDSERGRVPASDEPLEDVKAQSVLLDAPQLGMLARIDIIQGMGGVVVPVERKHGRPRSDGAVWEPEEMQVVAQALILRENGYRVTHGLVSFPGARTRVSVEITPEREQRLHEALKALRTVAAGPCPAPLVESPKCPRCSLVGICLPDETELLGARRQKAARRLIAPVDDARPLHVVEQGARIGRQAGRVVVSQGEEILVSLRTIDVSSVAVYGNVSVSAPALRGFCSEGVPITHHTYGGWFVGVTTGPGHRNTELRIRQFAVAADEPEALRIARRMVEGKIRNQRTLLRRNARHDTGNAHAALTRLAERAGRQTSLDRLLGFEGEAAHVYFGAFDAMLAAPAKLDPPLSFAGRNRRPPHDPVNALLSFAYGLLAREAVVACVRVGFDPFLGLYHRPRYGRPSLALDLAEEFRPIVADSVVVGFINNGQARRQSFISRAGAFSLTPPARRDFVAAFERRMETEVRHPLFGYAASYRRNIELQARVLAKVLAGEIAEYRPFTTR